MMAAMANKPFHDVGYSQVPDSHEKDVPVHNSDISNNNLDESEATRESRNSKLPCSSPCQSEGTSKQAEVTSKQAEVTSKQTKVTRSLVTDMETEVTRDQVTTDNKHQAQEEPGEGKDCHYEPGSAAWVKLDRWPWWPARVIPKEECTVLLDLGRCEPAIACVHFLIENNYDVIYDMSRIKPWVESTNQELLRKTMGWLKSKPKTLDLFQQVLSMLEIEYGITVPTLPPESPSKLAQKKSVTDSTEERDDKYEVTAPTLLPESPLKLSPRRSVSDSMDEMDDDDPPTLSKCTRKVVSSPKSTMGKIPGIKRMKSHNANGFSKTASISDISSRSTNISTQCSERLSDKIEECEGTAGGSQPQGTVSTSPAKDSKKPNRRKRAKSPDAVKSRKKKSQKRLEQSFGTEETTVKTLPWDHNIQEDSCDAEALEPLPPSQPERASSRDDNSMTEEDSDDDDLPDVLSSTSKDTIEKGTLLWVKYYRFPYWPAIVKYCYSRKKTLKKITVVFIGDGVTGPKGQPYSLPYNASKMVMFGASNARHLQFKEDGLKSPYAAQFKVAVDKVEDYLVKKCLQTASCPFTFFADDLVQDKSSTEVIEDDDKVSQSSYSDVGEQDVRTGEESNLEQSMSDNTEDFEEEDDANSEEMSKKMQQMVERRKERGERLVSIIKSDKMKNYLMEIYKGQQASHRHKQYIEDESIRLNATPHDSGFGPIDDEDQQMEIVKVLAKYLQEAKGSSLPDLSYIFHVWLPEAIIWSLNRILKKTWEVAEETYLKGPFRLKEEKQIEHRRMIESGKNIAPEDAERYRQKLEMVKEQIKSGSRT